MRSPESAATSAVTVTLPVVTALREALGTKVVQLPHEFAGRRHADASRMPCAEPIALLRPATTEEVATALS